MLAYYAAALPERLGLMKIGETLRNEYPLDPPMPEFLAALLAQLERSEHYLGRGWDLAKVRGSRVLTLAESCLRPFDRLDEVIRRSVIALVDK
jgi:hypothetical protein